MTFHVPHTHSFKSRWHFLHPLPLLTTGHGTRASWPSSADEAVKEYIGGVPVVGIRDASSASSSRTSIPHLPPIIRAPLTPIKDVSRETTQVTSLPPIKKGK